LIFSFKPKFHPKKFKGIIVSKECYLIWLMFCYDNEIDH